MLPNETKLIISFIRNNKNLFLTQWPVTTLKTKNNDNRY